MACINIKKKIGENNPIIAQRFMADPYAIEYNGRVYVYGSNDSDSLYMNEDGSYPRNQYGNIRSLNCVSSDDMVNWTDHGVIQVAADKNKGVEGVAKWAGNSWAPAATYKTFKDEVTGEEKTKFFLYFANSASSIGVLTADTPIGPWSDPIGAPMITRETPGCENVLWMFDPAVLMDDDGIGYIYFGGGVPEGKETNPMTARVAKLAPDMISVEGEAVLIDAPYMFEDSGINKFGDTYYYSYCTNWSEEAGAAMGKAQISYMTSKNPMGPFEYRGEIMKNPGQSEYFSPEAWGNNHHCMLQVNDTIYMFYHTPQHEIDLNMNFDMSNGGSAYRTTYVDVASLKGNGELVVNDMTRKGTAKQLKTVNPTEDNSAVNFVWANDVTTVKCCDNIVLKCDKQGGFIAVAGVDTNALSVASDMTITAGGNNNDCTIKAYIGSVDDSNIIAEFLVASAKEAGSVKATVLNKKPIDLSKTGLDMYIEVSGLSEGDNVCIKDWSFN